MACPRVYVVPRLGMMGGSMCGAAQTPGSFALLSLVIIDANDQTAEQLRVVAFDNYGDNGYCITTDPRLVSTAKAAGPNDYIQVKFQTTSSDPVCSDIAVTRSSDYIQ
jgi:hypothetical protein